MTRLAVGKHDYLTDRADPPRCRICRLPEGNRHHQDVPIFPDHTVPVHQRGEDDDR